ncbi:hypothetical protein NMY22_g17297 [Coprinellus aureogranulatus]|nr:hypothetical protein NMY22_g17297 [Coprinellus aureogranulatus]
MPRSTTTSGKAFTRLLLLTTTALSLLSPALAGPSGPNQCIAFDASWNLLAFNFDGKDYSLPSSTFTPTSSSEVNPTDITKTSGRPPFNAPKSPPLCYTSQFTNAVYVLNADAADPSAVYIFDATSSAWSKQATTLPSSSLTSLQSYDATQGFAAILDRDTNVFYALTKGNLLMSLDMGLLKTANASALTWNEVQNPQWIPEGAEQTQQEGSGAGMQGYEFPTMALAQNHVHFVGGVPGLKEGEAKIFVIHSVALYVLRPSKRIARYK